jgi:crotonobetainyl-CoA:carnitine CoA-transferase CaiB-like acyl-CoA transferase
MGNPIALADAAKAEPRFPPRLGENSAEVLLQSLDLTQSEVDELARKGVVKLG